MITLPIDPATRPTPEAFLGFLEQCRSVAAKSGRPQLASITLAVDALDPLAVLESIFDPHERHFYAERLSDQVAVAGAEAVLGFTAHGPGRFEACQRFIDGVLSASIVVGDQSLPFSGPHFFTAFSFFDEVEEGEPFEAASVFVPRWQVSRVGERTIAVANLVVEQDARIEELALRVLRAHGKFRSFDYAAPEFDGPAPASHGPLADLGGEGFFLRSVEEALGRIGRGEFEKIVLARAKEMQATEPLHPLRMLSGLRQRYPECHAFSVANGRGQSFIGASPERLLRVDGGELFTEALAGSVRRGQSASEDAALAGQLLRSDKDRREQRLVLESIERRLGLLGVKLEYPAQPGVRRLANVQHLHTAAKGVLPGGVRLLDVLAQLHPTPAVGGKPREAAVARIRGHEPFPRGLYAGALGWIDSRGGGEFLVGLRSALIDGATARLYAGAGIVVGSVAEKEFAETELKFKAMQEALLSS